MTKRKKTKPGEQLDAIGKELAATGRDARRAAPGLRSPAAIERLGQTMQKFANIEPEPLDTRLGVLGYAHCEHSGPVSTFIVPRANPRSSVAHRATAQWWRFDWCHHCGALRTWKGPADADAGPWLLPELTKRWAK